MINSVLHWWKRLDISQVLTLPPPTA